MANREVGSIEKEYRDKRISWKFFNNLHDKNLPGVLVSGTPKFQEAVLIQILKELQYVNDMNN